MRKLSIESLLILGIVVLLQITFYQGYIKSTSKSLQPPLISLKNNNAIVSANGNFKVEDDDGKFHMVTNILLFSLKNYSDNLLVEGKRPPTLRELETRQYEVETCLQRNLNHDKIAAIHVLYYDPKIGEYLLKLNLENSSKLYLHPTTKDTNVAVNLDFIQKYLKNKYVILAHMDNHLGGGWDAINFTRVREQRILYALTRQVAIPKNNKTCNAISKANCNPGSKYVGSHDAFVWFVDRNIDQNIFDHLNIPPNGNGMENVVIWYFRNKLRYKILNPCRRLILYHHHCVPIRDKGRKKRYNSNGKNGLAKYTDKLF